MPTPQTALAINRAMSGPRPSDPSALWTDVLKDMPLFADIPKRHVKKIASLTKEVRFARGSSIVRQGDRGDAFFVILEGSAEVRRNGQLIASMRGGDFFGEIALVVDVPRTATVKTTSPVRVLILSSREFRQLLRTSSDIQGKVLRAVAERLAAIG